MRYKNGAFAVRRVNLLAGLELDIADGQPVTRALVEQPHNLLVQPVNHLAMFGNAHNQVRMQNSAGRIKSVSLEITTKPPSPQHQTQLEVGSPK